MIAEAFAEPRPSQLPCHRCGKLLDIGREFHGIRECLMHVAKQMVNQVLFFPWVVAGVERSSLDKTIWVITWETQNIANDQRLSIEISETQWRENTIPLQSRMIRAIANQWGQHERGD
jgi:predicted neuraminidase